MSTVITKTEVKTSDTFFGAFLLATDEALTGIEREGRRVVFVFRCEDGHDRQLAFLAGAEVNARSYADAYLRLKQMVNDTLGGGL